MVTLCSDPVHLTQSQRKRTSQPGPLFLAGHLALDFLNTRMRANGKIVDVLQRDQDVLHWLKQAGLATPTIWPNAARMSLLDSARTLREDIRSLVEKRKAGTGEILQFSIVFCLLRRVTPGLFGTRRAP